MSINLVIEDIGVRDAGKGIARITEKKMQELGLEPYDVVEICGQRKSAIRVMPIIDKDSGKDNSIRIDGITRQNIKSSIKEKVIIKKADLAVKGVDAVPTSEGEVLQELLSHIA